MNTRRDIATEEDIKLLVDTFYTKVNADVLLSPVFNEFAKIDWPKHLPIMYNFWNMVLLGKNGYTGQPFPKHLILPISGEHFNRWLQLFEQTIDELFIGEKAEEAKQRAMIIAQIFQYKMGIFPKEPIS